MNWLNLRTEQLRSPTVAQASHEALATWLRVITYCCEQENGGRITGAAQWGDRAWMVACGVSALEVAGATPLLSREGEDILVSMYPLDKQKEVAKDRLNGKRGGRCKTQAKTQASRQNGTQGGRPEKPKPLPENNPSQNPTERKEKGIGKEVEGNGSVSGEQKTRYQRKGSVEEIRSFVQTLGLPVSDGDACFHKWEGNGWTNGGNPIVDWRSTIQNWKTQGFMPSQKNPPSTNGEKLRMV